MTNTINVNNHNTNANFIYTFAKSNQNGLLNIITKSTLSTLLNGSKKMQVKLRSSFAECYATKKIQLNTMSMYLLQILTPYCDIDMSIKCDLEHIRLISGMRRVTFEIATKQLMSMGLLVMVSEGKYFLTDKSHILVTPLHKNEENYLADYKILCDAKHINGLRRHEHRLLYFLVIKCASSPTNCYTPLVTRLYKNKRSRTNNSYGRTSLNSLEDLFKTLINLWRKNCIVFTLLDDKKSLKIEYNAGNLSDKAKSVDELYEQLINSLLEIGFKGKFEEIFVEHLKVNISCDTVQTNNDASKTELEGLIKTYTSNYNLQSMFADQNEIFNVAANPANLIINFKKELGVIVGPKLACELYSTSLESYVSTNASTLRYYVLHDKAVTQFKDFYLLKKIEDVILEQLKIFTILNNAKLPIDDTIQLKGIHTEISDYQFNHLIRYYSEQANRNHIIYFVDKLETIVANYKTKNESGYLAFLAMLTSRYEGLNHVFSKYFNKVRLLYANVVTKNNLNLSIQEFKQALPILLSTVGSTNTDTLKSYVEDIINEQDYNIRAAQVAELVEKYEHQLITEVSQLPLELVTIAKSRGVHVKFYDESPLVINQYYDSIFAVKRNTSLSSEARREKIIKIKDTLKNKMQNLMTKYIGYDELYNGFINAPIQNVNDAGPRKVIPFYNWLTDRS